jgi:hypothetical protein
MATPVLSPDSSVLIFGYFLNVYALGALLLFGLFLFAFYQAHKKKKLNWTDLICSGKTVKTTKLLQLIGGLTATFVVTKLAIQNSLTWDIFAIYLAYAASVEGFEKFILAKYGINSPQKTLPVVPINQPGPPPVV